MDTDPHRRVEPCPECYIGTLHPGRAFFCTTLHGHFISAPEFPAWICDVCGRREYDRASIRELETLVETRAGGRRDSRRGAKVGPSGDSHSRRSRPGGAK